MNRSNVSSKIARIQENGTLEATVLRTAQILGRYHLMDLGIPVSSLPQTLFGTFFLARCVPSNHPGSAHAHLGLATRSWDIYLRRPVFPISVSPLPGDGQVSSVRVLLPSQPDPGLAWLASQSPADASPSSINLTGPFGRQAELNPHARRLLLISAVQDAPLLIPLADQMLDRGGRVTFIVRGSPLGALSDDLTDRAFVSLLPLSVEVQFTKSEDDFQRLLSDAIPWSDSLAANQSAVSPQALAQAVQFSAPWARHGTGQREPSGRAYFLAKADLVCGYGACMACVVQRIDGSLTRACVHGPAFPLRELAG